FCYRSHLVKMKCQKNLVSYTIAYGALQPLTKHFCPPGIFDVAVEAGMQINFFSFASAMNI
ncbi:MAG: hypothetical protein KJ077_36710, partial [Anaerolineae bacterium]|nr:hypothetical protein [Anaerolineae bacterium]